MLSAASWGPNVPISVLQGRGTFCHPDTRKQAEVPLGTLGQSLCIFPTHVLPLAWLPVLGPELVLGSTHLIQQEEIGGPLVPMHLQRSSA